jgi:alkyl hydroperoxide reductase subunit D
MITQVNETLQSLYDAVGLQVRAAHLALQQIANKDMRYAKDLKINITNSLKYENLSEKESALLALSVAINEKTK